MLLCRGVCTGYSCCVFGWLEPNRFHLKAHFVAYFHKTNAGEFVPLNSFFPCSKDCILFFLIIWMTKLVSRCLFSGICYSQSIFFIIIIMVLLNFFCSMFHLHSWTMILHAALNCVVHFFLSWVALCSHFIHSDADMLDIVTRKRLKILHCRYFFTHLSNTLTRFFLVCL